MAYLDFMNEYDLKIAASFYVIEELRGEDLPKIAEKALCDGLDSPSLRRLAGEPNTIIMSDAGPLFEKSLAELGILLPGKDEACFEAAKFYARKIIGREIAPYIGAKAIWKKIANKVKKQSILHYFIGAASELEEIPIGIKKGRQDNESLRREYESDILKLSNQLLKMSNYEEMYE